MRESAVHYPELIRGASIGFADFLLLFFVYLRPSIARKNILKYVNEVQLKSFFLRIF